MNSLKHIKIVSSGYQQQNYKQTFISEDNYGCSAFDFQNLNTKPNSMVTHYSLLLNQIKKLSIDNDRLWAILTEADNLKLEYSKIQQKLRQNLSAVQKQLDMMKQMYQVQKSNFIQSKTFYEKRQKQWQNMVSDLKDMIYVYKQSNKIDLNKNQMHSEIQKFSESKINLNSRQSSINSSNSLINLLNQSNLVISDNQYVNPHQPSKQILKSKSNNRLLIAKSSKAKFQGRLLKQIPKNPLNSPRSSSRLDPEQLFTQQDILESAIRQTYLRVRNSQKRVCDILQMPQMKQLRMTQISLQNRLKNVIQKVFLPKTSQIQPLIQFIKQKVKAKFQGLSGDGIYKYLKQKLTQCQQIYQTQIDIPYQNSQNSISTYANLDRSKSTSPRHKFRGSQSDGSSKGSNKKIK